MTSLGIVHGVFKHLSLRALVHCCVQYTINLPYSTHFERLRLLMYTSRAVFYCPYIDVYTTVGGQPLGIYPTFVERCRTAFE